MEELMFRHLISLITAFIGFVGFLLMGNAAMANPVENSLITDLPSDTFTKVVNLNISSPFLELNNKTNFIFDHQGCSCAVCTQATTNLESKN